MSDRTEYRITGTDHDENAAPVTVTRPEGTADRTAQLMRDCGYREVVVEPVVCDDESPAAYLAELIDALRRIFDRESAAGLMGEGDAIDAVSDLREAIDFATGARLPSMSDALLEAAEALEDTIDSITLISTPYGSEYADDHEVSDGYLDALEILRPAVKRAGLIW